jgi:hypothetical protein
MVNDYYLLMAGDGFPGAAGDPDFFCPDRRHDASVSQNPYVTVRKRTALAPRARWSATRPLAGQRMARAGMSLGADLGGEAGEILLAGEFANAVCDERAGGRDVPALAGQLCL